MTQKLGLGFGFTKKAYFVCGSYSHLIKYRDFHEKIMAKKSVLNNMGKNTGQREIRPVWNSAQRINHQNKFLPSAVLTRFGRVPVSAAKQSSLRATTSTSTFRPVNTTTHTNRVIVSKLRTNAFHKSHSPIRRPFYKSTSPNTRISNEKVNTVRVNGVNTAGQIAVSAIKGTGVTSVKASAGCVWRPKMTDLNNVSKDNSGSWVSKRGNPQKALKNKGIFDSGCSRHMTWNTNFFIDYQDIDGGFVDFSGSARGGKIIGKGKIRTDKLDFEDVFFVKELKFNLFSISQMCDKKNSVLFTETECLVFVSDFKAIKANLVLTELRNTYGVDVSERKNSTLIEATRRQGPNWLFDIDSLTNSMNYQPVTTGNQTNKNAAPQEANGDTSLKKSVDARQSEEKNSSDETYKNDTIDDAASETIVQKPASENEQTLKNVLDKMMDQEKEAKNQSDPVRKEFEAQCNRHHLSGKSTRATSTNNFNIVSTPVNTAGGSRIFGDAGSSFVPLSKFTNLPHDTLMPDLEDTAEVQNTGIFGSAFDDEDLDTYNSPFADQVMGFVDPEFPEKVYKVEKALYGLHQAPRAWYETLSTYLLDNGFYRGQIDKTLFIKIVKDDILLSTPMETNKALTNDEDGEDVDVHLYSSTKSFPLECLSKKGIRYLKGQPNLGLWYPKDSPFILEAFSDSDYAGASLDRKSTTGGCQFLGSRLISWQCKKQTVVANSTTEAEYIAASHCCGQVLWIQNQMLDYGYNFMQTKIHVDNESAICVVKNPGRLMVFKCSGVYTSAIWIEFRRLEPLPTETPLPIFHEPQIEAHIEQLLPSLTTYQRKRKTQTRKRTKKDTKLPQTSVPQDLEANEVVHKEGDDSVERAITIAASLDTAQDSDNIIRTQTMAMPNVDIPQGMDSGGSPRRQDTIGGAPAQTRSERVLEQHIEPPLSEGHTSRSREGMMEYQFELTDNVLDLEKEKDAQAVEILRLKNRSQRLERQGSKALTTKKEKIQTGDDEVELTDEESSNSNDEDKVTKDIDGF
ncbi:ribonuclease H-like domain-containing protein [Tanacetum coccineum]